MKRISLVAGLVAAAAVALAVSSCAPAVHPTPVPTIRTRTTTPHPAATQAAVPSVRVPVKCVSLLTDGAAAALMDSPVSIHVDESTPPVSIDDITARQYGSLRCVWAGDRQDSGYDEEVSIDVTPDAAAGYAANSAGFESQDAPVTINTAGDKSVYGCAADGGLQCVGNMLVGSYWVTATILNIGEATVPQATAAARMQQVLTAVAPPLRTAKAGPAWKPAGRALPGFCSAAASTASVNAALGVSDFSIVGEDDDIRADAGSYTQLPDVYAQCSWGGAETDAFTSLSVALLRGGAWVLPQLPGQYNAKAYMLGAFGPMSVPGATAAAGNCSVDADECEVAVSVGSLLVVIDLDDPSPARSAAAIAAIVADIKAS